MFDFHEKRKIRKILYSKPVIGLICVFVVLLSFSVFDRYVVSKEMKHKLDAKYAELEEMKLRAQALESKVEYLRDERGIEEELRNRFDVAKEGEQVIILLESGRGAQEEGESPISSGSAPEVEEESSFLSALKFW
jgi:cell division protein FtsB